MRFKNFFLFLSLLTLSFSVFAAFRDLTDQNPSEEMSSSDLQPIDLQPIDLQKVSQAFGHLIGKHLLSQEFGFDSQEVLKGMQDSLAGKESPMNETECMQAIFIAQERELQKREAKNLEEANAFMMKNAKEKGIIVLEADRLQCKIQAEGKGPVVDKHSSPTIRYSGKCLDGKVFGASEEDALICLNQTIPGFAKGIIGMKEGEKRTLYIHPELGYGTSHYVPPNSLLIFDVEVVKAHTPIEEEIALSSPSKEEISDIASNMVEQAVHR